MSKKPIPDICLYKRHTASSALSRHRSAGITSISGDTGWLVLVAVSFEIRAIAPLAHEEGVQVSGIERVALERGIRCALEVLHKRLVL